MTIKETIRSWFVDEVDRQKIMLEAIKKSRQYKDVDGYWELVSMREKLLKVSERELQKLDKKQNEKF